MPEQLTTRFEFDQLVFILSFLSAILSTGVFVLAFLINYRRASVFVVPLVFSLTLAFFITIIILRTLHLRRCRQSNNPKMKLEVCSPMYARRSIICAWIVAALWLCPMGLIWLQRFPETTKTWEQTSGYLYGQLFMSFGNVVVVGGIAIMLGKGRRQWEERAQAQVQAQGQPSRSAKEME